MAALSSPNGGGPSAPFRIPVGVGGKETAPPDLQPDSFGCVPLRFVFGGLLYSLTQIRPSPLLNQAIKAAAPVLRDHVTLAPVHDATIDEAVAALARRLFDRSRCGAWVRCPSKFVRLAGGGERIRTCMGLFLSSSSFGLLSVLCSERESRSSFRRCDQVRGARRKGSRDRNGSKAWRLAA